MKAAWAVKVWEWSWTRLCWVSPLLLGYKIPPFPSHLLPFFFSMLNFLLCNVYEGVIPDPNHTLSSLLSVPCSYSSLYFRYNALLNQVWPCNIYIPNWRNLHPISHPVYKHWNGFDQAINTTWCNEPFNLLFFQAASLKSVQTSFLDNILLCILWSSFLIQDRELLGSRLSRALQCDTFAAFSPNQPRSLFNPLNRFIIRNPIRSAFHFY